MVTAGEVLKTKRKSLGKTIQQISQETKIQERFLEYIENNEYEKFDSNVFVSGFIKIYSKYLGLDTERVLALYRRSNGNIQKEEKKGKFINSKTKKGSIFTPRNIAIFTTIVFLLGLLSFIGYEIFLFQNPPKIEVTTPSNNITTNKETLIIEGSTENTTQITIEDESISPKDDGTFSFEYTLKEGENEIAIIALKEKTRQEELKVLNITYVIEEEEEEEEKAVEGYTLKIVIENDVTWIKLDVDGLNKISQVLEPSEREYVVEERFNIVSGRPSNTTIYLNNEIYELKEDPSSGTFTLSCEILKTGPLCQ